MQFYELQTFIFHHVKKSLQFQGFSVVHHPSNYYSINKNLLHLTLLYPNSETFQNPCPSPVLLNVWPRNEAHFRRSSSFSSSFNPSKLAQPIRSKKFFHSSEKNKQAYFSHKFVKTIQKAYFNKGWLCSNTWKYFLHVEYYRNLALT